MPIDWGKIPEWLSAIGAVLAVVFAGIAARAALRANAHQSYQIEQLDRRDREDRVDRIRAQAALVAAWVVPDGSFLPQVYFRNGSQLPINSVTVLCHSPVGTATQRYSVRGPDAVPVVLSRTTGALRALGEAHGIRQASEWSTLLDGGSLAIALSFMDSSGRWWVRDTAGSLTPYRSEAAAREHPAIRARGSPAS